MDFIRKYSKIRTLVSLNHLFFALSGKKLKSITNFVRQNANSLLVFRLVIEVSCDELKLIFRNEGSSNFIVFGTVPF